MVKFSHALLTAFLLSCQQNEQQAVQHKTSEPKTTVEQQAPEITTPTKTPNISVPLEQLCTIDLSDNFIPELMSQSREADKYFSTDGTLNNPFERERFGIYSSFAHHKELVKHYAKAIERRGSEKQPSFESKFMGYTTSTTISKINSLEKTINELRQDPSKNKNKEIDNYEKQLNLLQKQVEEAKNLQKVLQWEGFYAGKIDGIFVNAAGALVKYQSFHQQHRDYIWEVDGRVNALTIPLLAKNFEEYALSGAHRVLEERVFHAKCDNRHPYVIEQKELKILVESAAKQFHLDTVEGAQAFFEQKHGTEQISLLIPDRYKADYMKLEVDVEKWDSGRWERVRTNTNIQLYTIGDGKRTELFRTKAVVGGWGKLHGIKKFFKTPEGEFYLKSLIVLPHWNPPSWAKERYGEPVTLSGPLNAFGMMATVLHRTDKPQENPFKGWQEDDDGFRIHLTAWPYSVESGYGFSHGCTRIHPTMSRMFYFMTGYTPHTTIFEKDNNGQDRLKFTEKKGSYIPYDPENFIKVRICKERCE